MVVVADGRMGHDARVGLEESRNKVEAEQHHRKEADECRSSSFELVQLDLEVG